MQVARGRKSIALERQVRIAAGSIVFVGSALTFFVHPWLIAIPAFVGARLVFAGVTDTCGMGMLIARMPWNQVTRKDENCAAGDCRVQPFDEMTSHADGNDALRQRWIGDLAMSLKYLYDKSLPHASYLVGLWTLVGAVRWLTTELEARHA